MNRNELLIEPEELAARIDDANLRLFDATVNMDGQENAYDIYLKGHLPGAAFLNHDDVSDATSGLNLTLPSPSDLCQKLGALGISNDSFVVVYATGMMCWATRIWWLLRYLGHREVRVLNGGLQGWTGETETSVNQYDAASFSGDADPSMFASRDEVIHDLKNGSSCIVNTLLPNMYNGEVDSYMSGHIPGSVNHPLTDLMDGPFMKSDEDIRRYFADNLKQERMVTYCGGGVAATLNASAALIAGVADVAVYDGSLADWTAADMPILKGAEPGNLE